MRSHYSIRLKIGDFLYNYRDHLMKLEDKAGKHDSFSWLVIIIVIK
ncbi:MAG: hypothetical protein ACLUGF_05670 [Clostridium sp.]